MSDVQEALRSLKLKAKAFPVESIIEFYLDCKKPCYIEYYQGTKLLLEWLDPIAPLKSHDYPDYAGTILLNNYEICELASHISKVTGDHINTLANAIIHTIVSKVYIP